MSVLGKRVLAAAVMIPAVVAMVYLLPTPGFALALLGCVALAALEWPRIAAIDARWRRWFFAGAVALSAGLALLLMRGDSGFAIGALAMLYWALALAWVVQAERNRTPAGLARPWVRTAAGWATLLPSWAALVVLHSINPGLVMLVLVLIWLADSAAYFAGRRFGRRRLAARVSPGKSWEGVAAGLAAVAVLAFVLALGRFSPSSTIVFVVLCVGVAALSVLGDLTESLFKRFSGVKDSGALIPGHGGVLDRIDSLTAAAPGFLLGWRACGFELS